jgi:hypothetical protein
MLHRRSHPSSWELEYLSTLAQKGHGLLVAGLRRFKQDLDLHDTFALSGGGPHSQTRYRRPDRPHAFLAFMFSSKHVCLVDPVLLGKKFMAG